MMTSQSDQHIYFRRIEEGERTSLLVLVQTIAADSDVLDLGCGSGALGQYLTRRKQCRVDGLTLNHGEAEMARAYYRKVVVADLETADLPQLFAPRQYDAIVCADVLEHLRTPQHTLQAIRRLLKPGGKLLISIPNTGYAGLAAELVLGEFRYREEGLLDATHLRHFTRRSLLRFLTDAHWQVEHLETIERQVVDSEFHLEFDRLPPAVARYFLAMPDALSYQFIVTASPADREPDNSRWLTALHHAAQEDALFTAQLYWLDAQGGCEDHKLTRHGIVGKGRQTLRFDLSSLPADLSTLRLDPADRPGFLHLYAIRLCNDRGQRLWGWDVFEDGIAPLQAQPHHDLLWNPQLPALAGPPVALLTGQDPWLHLPIPDAVLRQVGAGAAHTLEVEMGWPFSADYLALAHMARPLQEERQALREQKQALQQQLDQLHHTLAQQGQEVEGWQAHLHNAQEHIDSLQAELARQQELGQQQEQDIAGWQSHQRNAQEHIDSLQADLARQQELGQQQEQDIARWREQWLHAEEQMAHLQAELTDRENQVTQQEQEIAHWRDQQHSAQERVEALQQAEALWQSQETAYRQEADALQLRIQTLDAELHQRELAFKNQVFLTRQAERRIQERARELERVRALAQSQQARLAEVQQTLAQQRGIQSQLEQQLRTESRQGHELLQQHTTQQHDVQVLRQQLEQQAQTIRELNQHRDFLQGQLHGWLEHLRNLENSRLLRYSRPFIRAKQWLLGQKAHYPQLPQDFPVSAGRGDGATAALPATIPVADAATSMVAATPVAVPVPDPISDTVDIIVPIYRGLADTMLCVESVLASTNRTASRLIAINDASPEPEVTQWLRDKAKAEPRLTLLENVENLGFVGTVNRGMAYSGSNDVLLLNSDTEVANDWLDRIRAAAYSSANVASVTPFSTNATICSYPLFCQDNPLPPGQTTASLDAIFASVNAGQSVEVPTGVGFCMYIRRDCLREVGLFDVENFGKGYGEENDFCQRAIRQGWRNLHTLDCFVLHTGGVSFREHKSPREQAAMETLRRLHPRYEADVHAFLPQDPARAARAAVDWVLYSRQNQRLVVLSVLHNRGGGTTRHVHELAQHLRERVLFLTLKPSSDQNVVLEMLNPDQPPACPPSPNWQMHFHLPEDLGKLVDILRSLGVAHVHYQHFIGQPDCIWSLPEQLGVAYDFTAHDFYSFCTNITLTGTAGRYLGLDGHGECCGGVHPPPSPAVEPDTAAWRERNRRMLRGARHVLTPSQDAARRIHAFAPDANVRVAVHTDIDPRTPLPLPAPRRLTADAPLRIAIIGAMSIIKGADVLEDVARLASQNGVPLEFHLVGYAYRHLQTVPQTRLHVHGQYDEARLPAILAGLAPDLVWFPAQWPETYSYTLSAALLAGLPVVAPDLGAFAERLQHRPWSWVQPWDTSTQAWLDFFLRVRSQHYVEGQPPVPPTGHTPDAALLPAWDYARDYVAPLLARQVAGELRTGEERGGEQVVHQHRRHLGEGERETTREQRTRQAALQRLTVWRSAPLLRPVARAIPQQWQRRVKNWLLKP